MPPRRPAWPAVARRLVARAPPRRQRAPARAASRSVRRAPSAAVRQERAVASSRPRPVPARASGATAGGFASGCRRRERFRRRRFRWSGLLGGRFRNSRGLRRRPLRARLRQRALRRSDTSDCRRDGQGRSTPPDGHARSGSHQVRGTFRTRPRTLSTARSAAPRRLGILLKGKDEVASQRFGSLLGVGLGGGYLGELETRRWSWRAPRALFGRSSPCVRGRPSAVRKASPSSSADG